MKEEFFSTRSSNKIIIEPGTFILGRSVEYFKIPKKIMGIVFGKSTYARSGILVNVTPLEPEWSGYITISISNISNKPALLYPMQGIAQVLFFESDEDPLFSYKDLKGKYNEQKDIIPAKVQ
jgi:dCTP deaminase